MSVQKTLDELEEWVEAWEGQRLAKGSLKEANLKDLFEQKLEKAYERGKMDASAEIAVMIQEEDDLEKLKKGMK